MIPCNELMEPKNILGFIAIVGSDKAMDRLVERLRRMEYRAMTKLECARSWME